MARPKKQDERKMRLRNLFIKLAYENGQRVTDIALVFGISRQSVAEIIVRQYKK